MLRPPRVLERVQLFRSNIYAKINRSEFPCAIPLDARAVGWLDTDIEAWMDAQAAMARPMIAKSRRVHDGARRDGGAGQLADCRRPVRKSVNDMAAIYKQVMPGFTPFPVHESGKEPYITGWQTAQLEAVVALFDKKPTRPIAHPPKVPSRACGEFPGVVHPSGRTGVTTLSGLRYRSTLAANPKDRVRLARFKLLERMGGQPGDAKPERPPRAWRKRHRRLTDRLAALTGVSHDAIRV